jgi:DNA-binding NarL/FixJ family response regulator
VGAEQLSFWCCRSIASILLLHRIHPVNPLPKRVVRNIFHRYRVYLAGKKTARVVIGRSQLYQMNEPALFSMQETNQIIKTAVVEDMRDIREGLTTLLNFTEGFNCTGSYRSMEEAIPRIGAQVPDVLLSDIGLPGMDGIEGIKILKEKYPEMTVLMLTVYDDDERIFDALCAGASGYLLKRTTPAQLMENIREAVSGGAPMSPEVAARVIRLFRDIRPPEKVDYDLTPHETRLLKLLVEGHNYTTAAEELGVSYNTIKFHMRHIYEKLQVHSKSEAVAKALQNRLV